MSYEDYLRYKYLSEMSDEERKAYLQHREVMNALRPLNERIDASGHHFWKDFGANVAGNAAWDGAVWLARALIKKL